MVRTIRGLPQLISVRLERTALTQAAFDVLGLVSPDGLDHLVVGVHERCCQHLAFRRVGIALRPHRRVRKQRAQGAEIPVLRAALGRRKLNARPVVAQQKHRRCLLRFGRAGNERPDRTEKAGGKRAELVRIALAKRDRWRNSVIGRYHLPPPQVAAAPQFARCHQIALTRHVRHGAATLDYNEAIRLLDDQAQQGNRALQLVMLRHVAVPPLAGIFGFGRSAQGSEGNAGGVFKFTGSSESCHRSQDRCFMVRKIRCWTCSQRNGSQFRIPRLASSRLIRPVVSAPLGYRHMVGAWNENIHGQLCQCEGAGRMGNPNAVQEFGGSTEVSIPA